MGIIAANIHGRQRATAFAVFAAGAPIGGGTGIVLGGVLTAYTDKSWRAVLWVLTGLAGLIALGALFVVPPDPKQKTAGSGRIDWLGAALVTVALVFIQFTIADGITAPKGWRTPCESCYVPPDGRYTDPLRDWHFAVSGILLLGTLRGREHVATTTPPPGAVHAREWPVGRNVLCRLCRLDGVRQCRIPRDLVFPGILPSRALLTAASTGNRTRWRAPPVPAHASIWPHLRIRHFQSSPFRADAVSHLYRCRRYWVSMRDRSANQSLASTFMAVSSRTQNYWTFPFNAMYLVVVGADMYVQPYCN